MCSYTFVAGATGGLAFTVAHKPKAMLVMKMTCIICLALVIGWVGRIYVFMIKAR